MVSIIFKDRTKNERGKQRKQKRGDELRHRLLFSLEAKGQTAEQGAGRLDTLLKFLSLCRVR